MASVPFADKRVGIEFTTIPRGRCYRGHSAVSYRLINRMRHELQHPLVEWVGTDPGCIEIPSTILNSWEDTTTFSGLMLRTARRYGCKQDSPWSTGGGGHIHISYKRWRHAELGDYITSSRKLREVANGLRKWLNQRPWVAWAFNDPEDNETAQLADHYSFGENAILADGNRDNLEFRFFDSATTVHEQVEHVAFALKMLDQTKRTARPLLRFAEDVRVPTLKDALKGWKQTIEELGLPWKLYHRYSRNIRERYALGQEYLN